MSADLILLRLKDLIASKDFETAKANYELKFYGYWLTNHESAVIELDSAIAQEFEKARQLFEKGEK